MIKRGFLIVMCAVFAVATLFWGVGQGWAQSAQSNKNYKGERVTPDDTAKYLGKVAPSEQKAAAMRARQLGLKPGVAGFGAQASGPGAADLGKAQGGNNE